MGMSDLGLCFRLTLSGRGVQADVVRSFSSGPTATESAVAFFKIPDNRCPVRRGSRPSPQRITQIIPHASRCRDFAKLALFCSTASTPLPGFNSGFVSLLLWDEAHSALKQIKQIIPHASRCRNFAKLALFCSTPLSGFQVLLSASLG